MRRREFIGLLGGAVAAWPLAARAQHERMHGVAMITGGTDENDLDAQANSLAFVHTMRQLGWVEGRNLRIDYFWGRGQPEAVRQHATDLAALAPDMLYLPAPPHWGSCCARHGRFLSCSSMSPTPSAAGSLIVCRGRAAMPPDSCSSNTA